MLRRLALGLGVLAACADSAGSSNPSAVDAASYTDAGTEPQPEVPRTPDAGPPRDDAAAPPVPPEDAAAEAGFVPARYDINHVLSTGQSNSVANSAHTILSTTQPFTNLMFDPGVMTSADCNGNGCLTYQTPTSFVPLVEGDMFFPDDPPEGRETMSSGLANEISHLSETVYGTGTHDVLVSNHARSGNVYYCLRKTGCPWYDTPEQPYLHPFDEAMNQVRDAKTLAAAAGKSYAVRAVTTIHGESDHYNYEFPREGTDGTPDKLQSYADALIEWQADYEHEVQAITAQPDAVPLLVAQMSDWNDTPFSTVAAQQYDAHVRAPGKVVLVTPEYMLPFAGDCLHLQSESQRRLGEYFAKAYAKIVLTGQPWEPVRPVQVTREANVVTVEYLVPSPPLVLDSETITDPGHFGFELVDDSGATPAITAVELAGPTTVRLTLAAAPTGANKWLRYALNAVPGTCPGPERGPRGNVRDSDATPSLTGGSLVNWSAAFQVAVP